MATREEFARVIAQLRDHPPFWHYVKMLEEQRDAVVSKLLYEKTTSLVEALRGEACAYDLLLKQIHTATKT